MKIRQKQGNRNDSRLEKKLSSYALAGAAILAAPAAHAGVITTPVNETFTLSSVPNFYTFTFPGTADTISITAQTGSGFAADPTNEVDASVTGGAMILNALNSWTDLTPAALGSDTLIDPFSGTWGTGGKMAQFDTVDPGFGGGNWPTDGTDAFLPFYFTASDGIHPGWADIATTVSNGTASFDIIDYAYESDGNTTITTPAPEPSTMALIALGGVGLLALRRRRASNA